MGHQHPKWSPLRIPHPPRPQPWALILTLTLTLTPISTPPPTLHLSQSLNMSLPQQHQPPNSRPSLLCSQLSHEHNSTCHSIGLPRAPQLPREDGCLQALRGP